MFCLSFHFKALWVWGFSLLLSKKTSLFVPSLLESLIFLDSPYFRLYVTLMSTYNSQSDSSDLPPDCIASLKLFKISQLSVQQPIQVYCIIIENQFGIKPKAISTFVTTQFNSPQSWVWHKNDSAHNHRTTTTQPPTTTHHRILNVSNILTVTVQILTKLYKQVWQKEIARSFYTW